MARRSRRLNRFRRRAGRYRCGNELPTCLLLSQNPAGTDLPKQESFEELTMRKSALIATALPAFALLAACGEDSAVEETGDMMEEQADAIEDLGDDRAAAMEEMADEAPTDAQEDALNARAEEIDDIGDDAAEAMNEMADEME
jgi:hypothetical protein